MRTEASQAVCGPRHLPDWVPAGIRIYLAHVEGGSSMRRLARETGVHASTVMRQVRRTEGLRDDPLADAALRFLETLWHGPRRTCGAGRHGGISNAMTRILNDSDRLDRETLRALRALSEPGTLLIIANGVEEAIVVRSSEADRPERRAVVPRDVAEILALKEWIGGGARGRLARYTITPAGRAELNRLMALSESRRIGEAGEGAPGPGGGPLRPGRRAKPRSAGAEPPLRVLARRKRGDGGPFLSPAMVRAAERFRESYEIARSGGALPDDPEALLAGRIARPQIAAPGGGAARAVPRQMLALDSLLKAVARLGPELAEAVILACCDETGMEQIEDRLDYPARSGKIVLRIALSALLRHYEAVGDEDHGLIY